MAETTGSFSILQQLPKEMYPQASQAIATILEVGIKLPIVTAITGGVLGTFGPIDRKIEFSLNNLFPLRINTPLPIYYP